MSYDISEYNDVTDPPDEVGEKLLLQRRNQLRTFFGDYYIYFDGFSWVSRVDRHVPAKKDDEAIAVADGEIVARGTVVDVRRSRYDTEVFVAPPDKIMM